MLVAEQHARAGVHRSARRCEPRGAAADDQHVAVRVAMLVAVGIGRARGAAHAGDASDPVLVAQPPAWRSRPHEGLVVEARGQQPREDVVDDARIHAQRRPPVLARRDQPVVEIQRRGTHVGFGGGALAHLHQRVRLLDAGGHDAARAVVLEAARDEVHAVGEQRRCKRVTRESRIRHAVEREAQRTCAIDAAAGGQAERLRHSAPPVSGSPGFALPRISWVRVSRRTLNHRLQPAL